MLVGFIGGPCSGKTTSAARLFAEFKDSGQSTEYIAERARWHIAKKKYELLRRGLESKFVLDDLDQLSILSDQEHAEDVMNQDNIIVITDSCVLNTFLYLGDNVLNSPSIQQFGRQVAKRYDVLFVCAPVARPFGIDPNRVHDEEASRIIHEKVASLFPLLEGVEVHNLSGTTQARVNIAFGVVMNKFAGLR